MEKTMDTHQLHKNSEFSIKFIKLVMLNFKQKENLFNANEIKLNLGLNSFFSKSLENNIQLDLGIRLKLLQEDNNNNIEIGTIEAGISGIFIYKNEINQKLLPNLASILYSYLRPIVAQISVMAKLPPIDLPVLDLSKIEVKEIKE